MYRVMIADDEPIVTKAMMTLTDWKALDCEVVYAAFDGQEVLTHLDEVDPDILITDIRMPGADGIEIARTIKEKGQKTKVILLTAYADFSYAQSAVKYDVVDYITKTGAFEGLLDAIEKAKTQIAASRETAEQPMLVQNFYKAIFDGTLYLQQEILGQAKQYQISLEYFTVALFRYRMEKTDEARMARAVRSLGNFFAMVFGSWLHQCVPIDGNTMAVVLNNMTELKEEEITEKCMQTVEMMDNFMRLDVYIGISDPHKECENLKAAFEEAKSVFECNFLDDAAKISFYARIHQEKNGYQPSVEKRADEVVSLIRKGMDKEAGDIFLQMTEEQIQYDYSANAIKGSGILIQNECRRLLKEQDKSLYDVTDLKPSITKSIYSCCYREDYQKILMEILTKTAKCLAESKNHKNRLILACESYINAHYHENLFVTDIADALGVSSSYLSRSFRDVTGETIIATINHKKLEQAIYYLDSTDMKIYEIADALGFENVTYFSHFFKKYMGVSPRDYTGNKSLG